MRKDEFPIVNKISQKDIQYLLDRYEDLLQQEKVTAGMAYGISICAGIAKDYLERIKDGHTGEDNGGV